MPIPVLIAIAIVIFGTSVVVSWDTIVIHWKGKRLALLGERSVGKTYLYKFLTSGSIPDEYKQSVPEKTKSRRFQLRELNLNIKEGVDIPGDKDFYRQWKEQYSQADIAFYLIRADRLIAGDATVGARVLADIKHIASWRKKDSPRLFIIGTHCDLDSEFATLDPNKMGDYIDKFRRIPIVSKLMLHAEGATVVLGSMKTNRDTEILVYEIFKQVAA